MEFQSDVTILGEIIGNRPPLDDNEYDDARRVLRSDWLAKVKADAWDEGHSAALHGVAWPKESIPNSYRQGEAR